jgi:hypothetical protein
VCPNGTMDCSGTCADVANDANNCGGCGTRCVPGHGCVNGACK